MKESLIDTELLDINLIISEWQGVSNLPLLQVNMIVEYYFYVKVYWYK